MTAEELRAQDDDDLRWVLSTTQGRRFATWLLHRATKIHENPYTADPNTTAYNLGRRAVGFDLLKLLERPEFLGALKKLEAERLDELSTASHHVPQPSESST